VCRLLDLRNVYDQLAACHRVSPTFRITSMLLHTLLYPAIVRNCLAERLGSAKDITSKHSIYYRYFTIDMQE
jgi:hypothetical protein